MTTHLNRRDLSQGDLATARASCVAPRPTKLADTGLSIAFLGELVEKHLFEGGVLTIPMLAQRLALAGPLVEEILQFLRREASIEVRAQTADSSQLRYALTERGRANALAALTRSGYIGPAPVPLDAYVQVSCAQSVRERMVTRERMHDKFADVVIDESLLDSLGPALNSGKALFVYGDPGTGKSYITQRLTRLLDDEALIPHAIAVGEVVIQLFDPAVHVALDKPSFGVMLAEGYDARFVLCRRPLVLTGGELTPEMLEVQFDPATRQYRAPLQLKASNGMFILDDLGRQRVPPKTVLNRWIVPMEEGRDYLSLPSGQHFSVPFDVILVFSTNLDPGELADQAFLRRIGYKIRFRPLDERQYRQIWRQVCEQNAVAYEAAVCDAAMEKLHRPTNTALLPCHPRDLIGMALDRGEYLGREGELTFETVEWAWHNYFVGGGAP